MRLLRARVAPAILALVSLAGAACGELFELPTLDPKDLKRIIRLAESSRIYSSDGSLLASLHGPENRTVVPLTKISKRLQDAVIAIEDERFYEHEGVDLRAITRALISNLTSGNVREGGSTITQQYVKNTLISPGETAERSLQRKIREAALARQLEKKLTKDEILERYLNTIYFGNGAYGIQAAARTYFRKSAKKLTLAESALVAGIIRAPEDYDPFQRRKQARERRAVVLSQMERLEMVPPKKIERAKASNLGLKPRPDESRYPAPYFVDYVHRLIKYDPRFEGVGKSFQERERLLFQGGLRIYTTIDMDMQKVAEAAVREGLPNPEDPHASLVAIDPNTGEVKAMVGGRDWFVRRKKDPYAKLNLAIQGEPDLACQRNSKGNCRRQADPGPAPGTGRHAGSAFKVFALAEALRQGVPITKTYSAPNCIDLVVPVTGELWQPCNYEGSSYGSLTLADATTRSVNTVYAQLIMEVGAEEVVDLARDMGIRTPLAAVPSAVLGSNEVNPLGMASAFGTFAANGTYHPPVAITKIADVKGKVLYEDETLSEQVLDPAVAYMTTQALERVITGGTGARYGQIGRPAAGKTGTAQEYRDAWFVGYTPDLVTSVWVGYPGGQIEMKPSCAYTSLPCRPTRVISGSGVTGGSYPTLIWGTFMQGALQGYPPRSFTGVDVELVEVTLDMRGDNCLAGPSTPARFRKEAVFPKGTEPVTTCDGEDSVAVPDVVGFPFEDAQRILQEAGFIVSREDRAVNDYPPGRVIEQSPPAGSETGEGSIVRIVVSAGGSGRTTVPVVIGATESEARQTLESAGFLPQVIREAQPEKGQARRNSGRVWQQQPRGGAERRRGSTVTIWVNP